MRGNDLWVRAAVIEILAAAACFLAAPTLAVAVVSIAVFAAFRWLCILALAYWVDR